MGRISWIVAAMCLAGVDFGGISRAASAQSPSIVPERRLALPLGGSSIRQSGSYWMSALAPVGKPPVHERLIVVAPDGRVIDEVDGDDRRVVIPAPLGLRLNAPDAGLILVHNHPLNVSLSAADLTQLRRPGVRSIVAVGHDLSLYEATAGPAYDPGILMTGAYSAIQDRVINWLRLECYHAGENPAPAYQMVSHLMAEILDRAGVIAYRAKLSREHEEIAGAYSTVFHAIVGAEAARLKDDARKRH